tara:strand:- start:15818 stop:16024 length:207 start_codon:yes stop_codon:yes gene_type:complete
MNKIDKIEFFTRVEAARKKLPYGIVPIMVAKYKHNPNRVRNVLKGITQDEKILSQMESMIEFFESENK